MTGHAEYLAGCEFCLRCRGRADKHMSAQKDMKDYLDGEDEIPMCSMDFCFLAQEDQEKATPTLVIKEHRKKYMAARACPGKSTVQEEYSDKIVEWTAEFLDSLGYPRIALKSDGENSMKALQRRVQQKRSMGGRSEKEPGGGSTVLTNSKKGDSQSNGMAENAVQEIEGRVRTLKLHLEHRIGKRIPPHHPVLEWLIEWAAEVHNRFLIGKDGKTPRESIRGKHRMRPMAEFGESVYYLPEFWPDGKIRQMEPKFFSGLWLGACPRTDEALIGTDKGLVRANTVKRKPIESAFVADEVLNVKITPGGMERRVMHGAGDEDDGEQDVVKLDRTEEVPGAKRMKIMKDDFEEIGFTDGCPGCNAIRAGKSV